MAIPKDQQNKAGKSEIKKSLQTRDKRVAQHRARLLATQMVTVAPDGTIVVDYGGDENKEIAVTARLAKELRGSSPTASQSPPNLLHEKAETQPGSPLLSVVWTEYCEVRAKEGGWNEQTTFENQVIFDLFLEIIDDMPIKLLGHEQARAYARILRKIPPRRNVDPRYRGLSLEQIISKAEKTMGVSSVNRHLGVISGMLTWAIGQGYINSNVISGKSLNTTVRADKQRKIFSSADLKKIFGRRYRGKHPYCKWLPLMSLYSGARLEELASLYKSDIRKINDIWCYDINTEHGRRVKNAYSVRLVPIHSVLIKQFYFLDFVKSVKHERLFPELKLYRGKYSKEASKWFGRYLDRLGITDPKKSFHSLRHNVMDYLKQHRVEDPLVKSLTGQAGGSLSLDRYGKPYVVETLQEVVEQLEFPIT